MDDNITAGPLSWQPAGTTDSTHPILRRLSRRLFPWTEAGL